MELITDIIRRDIYNKIHSGTFFSIIHQDLFYGKNGRINFELLLVDHYNTLMIKKRMNDLSQNDIITLNLINDNEVKDLTFLLEDFYFVKELLSSSMAFHTFARLNRQEIMRLASMEKEDNALTRGVLYKINSMANMPSYKPEDLLEYYKEYIAIYGEDFNNHSNGADMITNHILDLKEKDLEKYAINVLTAIPSSYKLSKFNNGGIKNKLFMKKIELMNIKSILEKTKKDSNFLYSIISRYLYYETLPPDLIEEAEFYLNKNLSKKMKKKLDNIKRGLN